MLAELCIKPVTILHPFPSLAFRFPGSSPQYGGMLAYREESPNRHRWVFLYKRTGQNLKLLSAEASAKPPKGYQKTDLIGFAKEGANDKAKILRGDVWVPTEEAKRPEELDLHFGSRQEAMNTSGTLKEAWHLRTSGCLGAMLASSA